MKNVDGPSIIINSKQDPLNGDEVKVQRGVEAHGKTHQFKRGY